MDKKLKITIPLIVVPLVTFLVIMSITSFQSGSDNFCKNSIECEDFNSFSLGDVADQHVEIWGGTQTSQIINNGIGNSKALNVNGGSSGIYYFTDKGSSIIFAFKSSTSQVSVIARTRDLSGGFPIIAGITLHYGYPQVTDGESGAYSTRLGGFVIVGSWLIVKMTLISSTKFTVMINGTMYDNGGLGYSVYNYVPVTNGISCLYWNNYANVMTSNIIIDNIAIFA